jgi:2-oxoisovalerate dehydrogenase E2 component (dihydrolipoyl transacylase)
MFRLRHGLLRSGPRAVSHLRLLCASRSEATGVPFILADIGEGIGEVEVLRWHVQKGDRVRQFEPLVEVQSDKATVEITSRYDGIVSELGYNEGDMAAVGKPLCYIQTEQAPMPEAVNETVGLKSVLGADVVPTESASNGTHGALTRRNGDASGEPLAIPAVRRIAKEHGVDIDTVVGTCVHFETYG